MEDTRFSEAITETLEILNNVDKKFIEKLPQKFITFLEENKSDTYHPKFDYTKELKDLKIKEETKKLLGVMYMNYWCTSEEKSEYIELLNENKKNYELEIREKYNSNNLFKNEKKNDIIPDKEEVITEVALAQYNESLFRKIWNKILSIFKK